MALAGFDPRAAARVWERVHQERGSPYGDNTHDHSTPLDRWRRVSALVPTAPQYYRGRGTVNSDYEAILASNPISGTRQQAISKGMLGLLEAGAGAAGDYMATRKEQEYREAARLRERQALGLVQLGDWKIAPTKDGHRGIFGAVHNRGQAALREVALVVLYGDRTGRVLHQERMVLTNVAPGERRWSTYLRNVPGTAIVDVRVVETR